jgi:serine phosphatase RsbU (regulator of sigma subunit)
MRADVSTFPAELTVTRLGTSEPPLFAGFIRDITDRHRVEAERDRLLAEAVSARARAEAAEQRAAAARAAAEAARAEAEAAGIRVALLARASERMLAIRDYEEAPQRVVDAVVPALADWCAVAVRRDPRAPGPQAAAHRDPARAPLVRELSRRGWPGDAPRAGAVPSAGPGARELIEPVSDDDLRRLARDDRDLELLRALAPRAVLTVPLLTPGRLSGTITFAMAESGRGFEAEDLPFAASLAARIALALENARLLAEQSHIADTLQRSLLPPRLPAIPGLDLAARYRAAGEGNLVGGDFYDVFRSGDGVWTAILGDVAGKGPEAAAATALTRHTLRAAGLRASSPVDGLRLLNEALLAGAGGTVSRFASVVYTRLCSSDDGALATIGVGGHPPPLILRAGGGLEYADVRGTLLGAVAEIEVAEVDVRLAAGDTLLFYTDGVTEVRTSDPGYGERLMERTLREHADASAEVIVAAVERAAVEAQDGEPRDDIALIAVRVRAR